MLKLLIGLGNPGLEYEKTRHNAGFWWIDELARQFSCNLQHENKFHSLFAKTNLHSQTVFLAKPVTFMNKSGLSVSSIAKFYKIEPAQILVIHDELDLQPGQVKLKRGGSHAGHNGLKHIQACLGSSDFWRLRLGIAHPGSKDKVINWVLKKPSLEQGIDIDNSITRSIQVVPYLLMGEYDKATMLLHSGNSKK